VSYLQNVCPAVKLSAHHERNMMQSFTTPSPHSTRHRLPFLTTGCAKESCIRTSGDTAEPFISYGLTALPFYILSGKRQKHTRCQPYACNLRPESRLMINLEPSGTWHYPFGFCFILPVHTNPLTAAEFSFSRLLIIHTPTHNIYYSGLAASYYIAMPRGAFASNNYL